MRKFPLPDLLMAGAGAARFIDSLLPWYGYEANGWHPTFIAYRAGFLVFFPLLIVLLIGGTCATRAWNGTQMSRVGSGELTWNALFLIGDAAAFVLIVLRWATLPGLEGAEVGAKFGLYLGLILVLVQAAGAFLAMVAAGERLPVKARRAPVE